MFGNSAFAQAPFAALPLGGGTSFFEFLTENFGVADTNTQLFNFLQSRTEPITEIDDFNSDANIFIGTLNELISVAAANTEVFDALQSITEPLTVESQQFISAQFAQSVAENVNLNDTPIPFFASLQSRNENFILDDNNSVQTDFLFTQTENVDLNDVETITAQFAVSKAENVDLNDVKEISRERISIRYLNNKRQYRDTIAM